MLGINKTKLLTKEAKLFRLFGVLFLTCLGIAFFSYGLGNPIPEYDRNIYNNISSLTLMLGLLFMELSTIYYYKAKIRHYLGVPPESR